MHAACFDWFTLRGWGTHRGWAVGARMSTPCSARAPKERLILRGCCARCTPPARISSNHVFCSCGDGALTMQAALQAALRPAPSLRFDALMQKLAEAATEQAAHVSTGTPCLPCSARPTWDGVSSGARRYTLFIVLYPLGILLGEMPLYAAGLPFLRGRRLHSLALPNALNFSFDYHRACQARRRAPVGGGWFAMRLLCSGR